MQSPIQLEYKEAITLYYWVIEVYASDRIALEDEVKLRLRKACEELPSYPYELQIALAKLYKKYHQQLEGPNWSDMNLEKACELEWLKVSLLQTPEEFKNEINPFVLRAYRELLEEDVFIPSSLLEELIRSYEYTLQKYGVLFLKKALLEDGYAFEQALELVSLLFRSEFNAIVIGTIEVLRDFPAVLSSFPEKLFWMVSERDEMILISLVRILGSWGDHSLLQRLLEGESWTENIKREAVGVVALYPSKKYQEQLLKLLSSSPGALGIQVLETLKSFQLSGIGLSQKGIQCILSFYVKFDTLTAKDAAFLIQDISERTLSNAYSRCQDDVSIHRMIDLLSELENTASTQLLLQMYGDASFNWERNLLLDAFIKRGTIASEAAILRWFDTSPIKSLEALTYLGGKETAIYLREKLKLNEQKVDLWEWEEKAVKLIFQIDGFDVELLKKLSEWNVPYINAVAPEVHANLDAQVYSFFENGLHPNAEEAEVQNLQKMIVSIGDERGVPSLVKCLYHQVDTVRTAASSNLDILLSRLYTQRKLAVRPLLKRSCADAIRACRSKLIVYELLHTELDAIQQGFLLDFLLSNPDPTVLHEKYDALVQIGNLHFEKRLIEGIGIAGSPDLAILLLRYFNEKQDIFRLRQTIISAEKLDASHLSGNVEPFLEHRNMNVRKAAASFISKHGGIRSASALIRILKTQDNPGLRSVAKAALLRILDTKYQSYILNELKGCESERQIHLLQEALKERFRLTMERRYQLRNSLQFKGLVEDKSKTKQESKLVHDVISRAQLEDAISCFNELGTQDQADKKQAFLKSMKLLRAPEKCIVLDHIRRHLAGGKADQEFLFEVLVKNDGVLNDDLAIRALAMASEPVVEQAYQIAILGFVDFLKAPEPSSKRLYAVLFNYYYASQKKDLGAWGSIQKMDLSDALCNEYEPWEFVELLNDFWAGSELNTLNEKMLNRVGDYRADFILSVLRNTGSEVLTELVSWLTYEELHIHYTRIKSAYLKMEVSSRAALQGAISHGDTKLRLRRETAENGILHFETSNVMAVTRNDLRLIEENLSTLLMAGSAAVLENKEQINGHFWFLKCENRVASKVILELSEKDIFWNEAFKDVRQHLTSLDEKSLWSVFEPVTEKGNVRWLGLLRTHVGNNTRVLKLLQTSNEEVNTEVLKWLDNISGKKFYFPTLFDWLVETRPNDQFFETALNLIFKLQACDKRLSDQTYLHIQELIQSSDEATQLLVFKAMAKCASAEFLREGSRRGLLLEYCVSEVAKAQAFACILCSVNWYYEPDLKYVLDTLKKPWNQTNSQFIEQVLLQLKAVSANQQIRVYSMMLETNGVESPIHKSILELFRSDYQIVDSLGEEQRIRFLEECKIQLTKSSWTEDFAVDICKNLSLAQVAGYTQLVAELLIEHKSKRLRSLCLRELKKNASKVVYLDACENVLRKGDSALQSQVVKALSFAKRAQIIPLLIPLLFDKNSGTRKLAKNGILQIGTIGAKYLKNEMSRTRPDKREVIQILIDEIENIQKVNN